MLNRFSCVQLFVTPWTVALQALLSVGFSRQEYWSGLPCPPPRDLLDPRIEPASPTLQVDSSPADPLGKPIYIYSVYMYILCVDFLILNECIGFGFGVIKFIQQIPLRTFELLKTSFSYYKLVIFKVLFRSKLLPKYKSIYCFLKKVFL